MITHVEIDGFKSFLDFQLDLPPFLALVGPNASGKSNLFDALEYDLDAIETSSPLLGTRRGRPHELFHRVAKGPPVEKFALRTRRLLELPEGYVEVTSVVNAHLEDGRPAEGFRTFVLSDPHEQKIPPAVRRRYWTGLTQAFEDDFDHTVRRIEHAIRGEQQYVPDPQAMRRLVPSADVWPLRKDGGNLAAVLGRMQGSDAFDDLQVDLASLIPDIVQVVPELDDKRQEWSFDILVDGQGPVPSTLLSDGTLRILGLLAALHDSRHPGSLLIEEIENGLHPSRLAELLRRIQERVTDFDDPESLNRPLRQVVLTSHSPVVVSELYRLRPESLVFMDTAVRVDPEHERVSRVTIAKPVRDEGEPGSYVSPRQVRKYLSTVQPDRR